MPLAGPALTVLPSSLRARSTLRLSAAPPAPADSTCSAVIAAGLAAAGTLSELAARPRSTLARCDCSEACAPRNVCRVVASESMPGARSMTSTIMSRPSMQLTLWMLPPPLPAWLLATLRWRPASLANWLPHLGLSCRESCAMVSCRSALVPASGLTPPEGTVAARGSGGTRANFSLGDPGCADRLVRSSRLRGRGGLGPLPLLCLSRSWSRSSPRRLCCRDDPALLSARDSAGLDARLACNDGLALLPNLSKLRLRACQMSRSNGRDARKSLHHDRLTQPMRRPRLRRPAAYERAHLCERLSCDALRMTLRTIASSLSSVTAASSSSSSGCVRFSFTMQIL